MAQGDSAVSICNAALIHLGEDLITSLTDNTKRAVLCSALYDQTRRRVLRSHPWNCAKAQASLAASPTPPLFDWDYAYPLPADYLRMFDESEDVNDRPDYEIIGWSLLSDDLPPFNCVYIFDLQDPSRMDAGLIDTLALELAFDLCQPLTQSDTKLKEIAGKLNDRKADAKLVGSQENSAKEWDEDIWLRSRR